MPVAVPCGKRGVSTASFCVESFKSISGTQIESVMYKGGADALKDLMTGRVHVIFDNPQILLPLEKAGCVKLLATTGCERAAFRPTLPTMIEAGVPGYELYSWYGLLGPSRLPAEVVRSIESAMARVAAMPEVRARFAELGLVPLGSSAAVMHEFFVNENRKWEKVVREANIRLE